MSLEIKEYKKVEDHNTVLAMVSFYIPEWGITINDCRYIRSKKGGNFVGFPSRRVDDKYYPYIEFDKEKMEKFQTAALKAITEYAKNNQ